MASRRTHILSVDRTYATKFGSAWRKVRKELLSDKEEWKKPLAVAGSSRFVGEGVFKVSKHMVDTTLVFDSEATLKQLVEFVCHKELSTFTCKKSGEGTERRAVDIAVYGRGRVFRLAALSQVPKADTMLRVEGEVKDLASFFVVQPQSTTPVITVEILREKVRGFEAAATGRDRNRAIGWVLDPPPASVVEAINLVFQLGTSPVDWRVKVEDGGSCVFLKLRTGRAWSSRTTPTVTLTTRACVTTH